jgi:uroporphyrin-III C-methyltransferase/precorrin-2 dehydrogenase/sirohydrochlorin ferrochelatase
VLALTRRDAERLDVGKQARAASTAQEHIHALLLEHARRGRTVVRLKGGDPFVFGRGGEELEFLRANGVPVEVVPGITAALGAAARAQVPLTRRGRASGLRILSAESGATGVDVDWASHAASRDTLAVYMGLAQLDWLGPTLIQLGRPASTPVVLVAGATRVDEQIVHGTLAQLVALASNAALRSPVLLIVGEVAAGSVGQALSARELERAS